ncbi:MAG: hypothetical protein JWM53_1578 [bacterium]|nr:hypothetical protein [bacterium]
MKREARPELFELSLLGGRIERRFRTQRPEGDAMPWSTLDPERLTPALRQETRHFWTLAALAEHRAAAACAAVQRALVEARAPVDLIALGAGFVLDELAHVELCARVANHVGGGVALAYDANDLVPQPSEDLSPLGRAAELVLRIHCVNETFLLAMARHNRKEQRNPLVRAVLTRISKDEAAHSRFGWIFFDWANSLLDDATRDRLRGNAKAAIAALAPAAATDEEPREALGWLSMRRYAELAPRVLEERVAEPLRSRGLLL